MTSRAAVQLAWTLDWRGTATGSSTSALPFAFTPVYAFLAGGLSGVVAGAVMWGRRVVRTRNGIR